MSHPNPDQEIDLAVIGQKISKFIDNIGRTLFGGLQFVKKNIILIGTLFIAGAILGYFIDKNNNAYVSQIIVSPNFGSTDDLYLKVNLLKARLSENDTVFLKQIGLQNIEPLGTIEIDPVIDLYNFVNSNAGTPNNAQNTQNFELVKLLAEDGDIKKVVKDELTSKNYSYHKVKISSDGHVENKKHIEPILNYLNNSEYFKTIQKQFVENISIKINQNQIIIDQINALLNQFTSATNNQKNDKLVYYNENNQLNDIIKNKDALTSENGVLRIQLINNKEVVKEISSVLNEKDNRGLNGKMKLFLPVLFLFLFFGFSAMLSLYKRFSLKYS